MLQYTYDGDSLVLIDAPAPAPVSLVDQIRGTLSDPSSGGIFHHFDANGKNDWDVGPIGSATPLVFNYQGTAPADVLGAFPSASPLKVSQVIDPHGPGNGEGGSDLSNILAGVSFVTGGAVFTGGSGLFSTLFDSVSNAVSSVFTAAPAAEAVTWGALDAGPGALLVDAQAAAAYGAANAATIAALPAVAAVAADATPWGALDAGPAAIPVDPQAAAAYSLANAATVAALASPLALASVASSIVPTVKDAASIAASAAALTKAAASVATAGAAAAHPMAAFTSPFVLGTGADALAGTASPAAAPAAADAMPYAAFAIAGVVLVGIYFFVLRKR